MNAITQRELDVLCGIAEAAGREIMAVYESGDFDATRKDDESPLTAADLRADAVIRAGLERAFPGVFILSEESRSAAHATLPSAFLLVDPLDGTKEFLKRNGEFTVNIAVVRDGVPIAGVVQAPALGELFYGAKGVGAWKRTNGAPQAIHVSACEPTQPLRVLGSRSHGSDAMERWLDALGREHQFLAAGSSLKFLRIAEGAADAYPRMGPTSQWDTAAGQAVLEAAGGAVHDPVGQPLRYGLDRPILNPNFLATGDPRLALPPIT
ncbi:3'(2'),5'-bisphosphate nucleotidase CysQ [Ramlibacter sp. PS4R-6]|uniref:3'(2'),5'-bisphosphate nucleotidase CysQ n=1 Tax=Ramlibacter sp. PS4R-6 TaxID=3133438 RepID=UPI0030B58ADB